MPNKRKKIAHGTNNSSACAGEIKFTFFSIGYINRQGKVVPSSKPYSNIGVEDLKRYISTYMYAGKQTEELRTITDHAANSQYKLAHFCHTTFGCQCTYRSTENVTAETGVAVLDFDREDILKGYPNTDIKKSVRILCKRFTKDRNLCTVARFISPNGDGIKWAVYVGTHQGLTHSETFRALSEYIEQCYGVRPDKSGSDIIRSCFLPYDPNCYVISPDAPLTVPKIDLHEWYRESLPKMPVKPRAFTGGNMQWASNVFDLVESWVSRDTAYVPGSFNRYVSKCGYLLCDFSVPQYEATEWAVNRFNDYDSRAVRSIFASCYRHGTPGKYTFGGRKC